MVALSPNALFSAFAFVGFVLASLPLPWHMQSWNTGTCMFMLWTGLGCLIFFVNSVVWNDNVVNWAPVWCDISARYVFGGSVGLPASSLCIVRRLYHMSKMQSISVGKRERIHGILIDVSIGIGIPCVIMACEYVVQGHRFDIFEQIGCYPYVVNTLAGYLLLAMWPLAISLVGLVYAALTFRKAVLIKEELTSVLQTGFSMSTGKYWRLMAVCSAEIFFTISLSLYVLIGDAVSGRLVPYVSWAAIHSGFSYIGQYPTAVWKNERGMALALESGRWIYVLSAFVIFAFFGCGSEARDFYRQTFQSACRYLRCSRPSGLSSAIAMSNQTRGVAYSTRQWPGVDDGVGREMESVSLPMPIQVRERTRSSKPTLSFEASPHRDSLSSTGSSPRPIANGNPPDEIPNLPLSNDTPQEILPTFPEPALGGSCRSGTLNEDAGQLV